MQVLGQKPSHVRLASRAVGVKLVQGMHDVPVPGRHESKSRASANPAHGQAWAWVGHVDGFPRRTPASQMRLHPTKMKGQMGG